MRVYFDTNIYSMMADRGDANEVSALISGIGGRVFGSRGHLTEIMAIRDPGRRSLEFQIFYSMANELDRLPLPYVQAQEVLRAIRRHHREWLNGRSDPVSIKRYLRNHKKLWGGLAAEAVSSASRDRYRHVAEPGITKARAAQKELRKTLLEPGTIQMRIVDPHEESCTGWDLDGTDRGWRADCLSVWEQAILRDEPASRDYADYLLPYLRPDRLDLSSFAHFWMEEVGATDVPRNRLSGLAAHFQLQHKPGRGNAGDVLHAAFLTDVDVFVTGDGDFAKVLRGVAALSPGSGRVAFIDRGSASTVAEVGRALGM